MSYNSFRRLLFASNNILLLWIVTGLIILVWPKSKQPFIKKEVSSELVSKIGSDNQID